VESKKHEAVSERERERAGWGGVWGVRVGNGTTAAATKRPLTDTDNQSVRSSFVRSSVCAFVVVRSFVRSFVRAFVCLFVCSVVWSCGCLVARSLVVPGWRFLAGCVGCVCLPARYIDDISCCRVVAGSVVKW